MTCKIVRNQKLMWHNIIESTKSQTTSILYYIDHMHKCMMHCVCDQYIV